LLQAASQTLRYLRRKFRNSRDDRRLVEALCASQDPYFLVLLQRPGDSQLLRHSPFCDTESMVRHVADSFAAHAPAGARLVFKSHPLDHGLERQDRVVGAAAKAAGLSGRVLHLETGNLDSLLARAAGVVTVNSTAGLAAIDNGRPTMVLGRAIYDMPGLTHQAGLGRFWTEPEPPDESLYRAFRRVVMARTQINGAFASKAGIRIAAPEAARRLLRS
jgi:capsular polysaccharide export protein